MRGRWAVPAVVGAALLAGPLQAQGSRALQIGSPVRLVGLDVPGGVLTGMLARVTRDTVLVGLPGGTEAVPVRRAAVTHVYIQVGRRSGAGHASLVGMVVGTGVGSALALAFGSRMTTPGVFIVVGGAGGAMLGGLVGQYLFRVPRWEEAPPQWLDDVMEDR